MSIITILLYKKEKLHQHLDYIIDNHILIQPTYTGLNIRYIRKLNIDNLKHKDLKGYKLIGIKRIYAKNKSKNILNSMTLYNCISIGKILLGIKGLYISCSHFFNKIDGDLIWELEQQ